MVLCNYSAFHRNRCYSRQPSGIKHGIGIFVFFDEQGCPIYNDPYNPFILKEAIMRSQQATQHDLDQHDKIQAEIAKLIAETSKINSKYKWYPVIVGASATLTIVAVVKIFL
jgi:hypothetical protein